MPGHPFTALRPQCTLLGPEHQCTALRRRCTKETEPRTTGLRHLSTMAAEPQSKVGPGIPTTQILLPGRMKNMITNMMMNRLRHHKAMEERPIHKLQGTPTYHLHRSMHRIILRHREHLQCTTQISSRPMPLPLRKVPTSLAQVRRATIKWLQVLSVIRIHTLQPVTTRPRHRWLTKLVQALARWVTVQ